MIAIDTNILLRYVLSDDPAQHSKADKLINGDQQVLITDVVLIETVWTLMGNRYNMTRESIGLVISSLFEEKNINFEDGQTVWCAFRDFKKAKVIKVKGKAKQAGFADCLIVNKARFCIEGKSKEPFALFTFDRAAQEIDGVFKP